MIEAFWADDDVKWWLNVRLLLLKMKLLLIKKENKEDESSNKDVMILVFIYSLSDFILIKSSENLI